MTTELDRAPPVQASRDGGPVEMRTVVITGADTVTGMNAARALKGAGFRVVGVANRVDHPCCASNAWSTVLGVPAEPGAYVSALVELAEKLPAGAGSDRPVLILSQDSVVTEVASRRVELTRSYRFVLPEPDAVTRLMDKTGFDHWARAAGLPLPETCVASNPEGLYAALSTLPRPIVIKPLVRGAAWDNAFGIEKAIMLDVGQSLPAPAERLFELAPRFVAQHWISGGDDQVGFCLMYIDRSGTVQAAVTGRKLLQWPRSTGSTAACEVCPDAELEALALRIAQLSGMRGINSVETKRDARTGKLYITEPTVGRNDYQSGLATAAGVNIVRLAVADALGEPAGIKRDPSAAMWVDDMTVLQAVHGVGETLRVGCRMLLMALRGRLRFSTLALSDTLPGVRYWKTQIGGAIRRRLARRDALCTGKGAGG